MNKFSGRVFVFGNIVYNLSIKTSRFPNEGETVYTREPYFLNSGGKGLNQAITCAKFGAETYMLGSMGNDTFAEEMQKDLSENGVRLDYLSFYDQDSGLSMINIREDGQHQIVSSPSVNLKNDELSIESIPFKPGDILLSTLEASYEVLSKLFEYAKNSQAFVIVDPSSPDHSAIKREIYANIDIVKPNETEISLITHLNNEENTYEEILQELDNMEISIPLMSLGEEGIAYLDPELGFTHLEGLKVDAVDSTGAGDIFLGVLASSLAANRMSLKEAVQQAIIASGLSVMTKGALPSIPEASVVQTYKCIQW